MTYPMQPLDHEEKSGHINVKAEDTYTPGTSLKNVLEAICGIKIDSLRSDGKRVKVGIGDKEQMRQFTEQFATRFNLPEAFDQQLLGDERPQEFKPYMHGELLPEYIERQPINSTKNAPLEFLRRLIPPEDFKEIAPTLESYLKEADIDANTGKLVSKPKKATNEKTTLKTMIARIGNYFTFNSLAEIQHCYQTRDAYLKSHDVHHVTPAADGNPPKTPLLQTQTPFLSSDELHQIFRVETSGDDYQLVLDIQKLDALTRPLLFVEESDREISFDREHFALRLNQLAKPHKGVLFVDKRPVFTELYSSSETTDEEVKIVEKAHVHFVLDYSGSMKDNVKALKDEIIKFVNSKPDEITVDVTYFFQGEVCDTLKSCTAEMLRRELPDRALGGTPLNAAVEQAMFEIWQSGEKSSLFVLTDGAPGDPDLERMHAPENLIKCSFYGFGLLAGENEAETQEQQSGVQWLQAAQEYYNVPGSCYIVKRLDGDTAFNHFIETVNEDISTFSVAGQHDVTIQGSGGFTIEYPIGQGAGPLQAKKEHPAGQSEESLVRQTEIFSTNAKHFRQNLPTFFNLGSSYVSDRPSSLDDLLRIHRYNHFAKKWNELSGEFLIKMQDLITHYEQERWWFATPIHMSDEERYSYQENGVSVEDALSNLMKLEKAPDTTHPFYILQDFLRQQYMNSSNNCRQDIPWPKCQQKNDVKQENGVKTEVSSLAVNSSLAEPLLEEDKSESLSTDKQPTIGVLTLSAMLVEYRMQQIIDHWEGEQTTDEDLDKRVKSLLEKFVTDLGFLGRAWVCLTGDRQQYKKAKEIISPNLQQDNADEGVILSKSIAPKKSEADITSLVKDLAELQPLLSTSSYLYLSINFLCKELNIKSSGHSLKSAINCEINASDDQAVPKGGCSC
jgi:hypothetical protein